MIGIFRSLRRGDLFFVMFTGLWAGATAHVMVVLPFGPPRNGSVDLIGSVDLSYGCLGLIAAFIAILVASRLSETSAERLAVAFVVTAPVFGLLFAAIYFVAIINWTHTAPPFWAIADIFWTWLVASGIALFSGAMGMAVFWLLIAATTSVRRLLMDLRAG